MRIDDSHLARRCFLGNMLGGGVAALAAGASVPLVKYAGNLRPQPPPDFLAIERADYDLPPGKAKIVKYGPLPALLIRTPGPAGELKAFVATCTHLSCTVGYEEATNRILCACHGGYFDINGQVISGPPPEPLRQFHSKLRDGKLLIALEKEHLEKAS